MIFDFRQGHNDRALATAAETARLSRAIGKQWGEAAGRVYSIYPLWDRGDTNLALAASDDLIQIGKQIRLAFAVVVPTVDRAWIPGSLGAYGQALTLVHDIAGVSAQGHIPFMRSYPLILPVWLHVQRGELNEAVAVLRIIEDSYTGQGVNWYLAIFLPLVKAELALAQHDYAKVGQLMNELLAHLRATDTYAFVPDALCLKAQARSGRADFSEALRLLGEARQQAEALGSRRTLWRILSELSCLQVQVGSEKEAERLRGQARGVIDYWVNDLLNGLRQSFLNLPPVQAIYG